MRCEREWEWEKASEFCYLSDHVDAFGGVARHWTGWNWGHEHKQCKTIGIKLNAEQSDDDDDADADDEDELFVKNCFRFRK